MLTFEQITFATSDLLASDVAVKDFDLGVNGTALLTLINVLLKKGGGEGVGKEICALTIIIEDCVDTFIVFSFTNEEK
jgi:hypothetical protein